jgi:uncharacterized protein (TIGR02284 family)
MQTKEETISTLNDLVLINNDRIAGYEKALEELRAREDHGAADADLIPLFEGFITDSREFRNELGREVQVAGGEMETGTMASGKIYRAWMDIKALFSGKDRHTILSSCETGEDAAQRAYQTALGEEDITADSRNMINSQKTHLKKAHDQVKALRDQSA